MNKKDRGSKNTDKKGKKSKDAGSVKPAAVAKLKKTIAKKRRRIAEITKEIAEYERALGQSPGISPFAPACFPDLAPIDGVRFAAAKSGVRYKGRLDVMLAALCPGTSIAGVFTRSATRSAPVLWCEEKLAAHASKPNKKGAAIIVNAGVANAFTGRNGHQAVETVASHVAKVMRIPQGNVFMASTGVIGEPLESERITDVLQDMKKGLDPAGLEPAAHAIMTTDTFAKGASLTIDLDGVPVHISGIAKGSGMIAPDMGTMLVFIFTDASIHQPMLQRMLSSLTNETFNAITVDGDTSTSDTLLVAATGQAPMKPLRTMGDKRAEPFRAALGQVMHDLSLQVVGDGEGASKRVAITVTGAASDKAARRIGLSIANSPLVKTAIAGQDPNWGRIVMAVGKSGEAADRDKLSIRFGDILVADTGWRAPDYDEAQAAAYMQGRELSIAVDVGIGQGQATVWTCDLTHGYIDINADYRS